MIRWKRAEELGFPTPPNGEILVAYFGEGVVLAAMQMEEKGSFVLTFTQTISEKRTLPEVEDYIRRCAAFLTNEPVIP